MKRAWLFFPLLLLLAACGGGGVQTLNVILVDGIGEPLQPLAAAWRVGPPPSTSGLPWNALPTGLSSWSLPIPSGARFQVAFRCPSVGGVDFYVSLDLKRNELGSNLMVRCPVAYASPTAAVSGTVSPSLGSGTAFSAWGALSLSGGSFAGLTAPTGPGREIAVFGDSGSTPHFGRTGPVSIPPAAVTVSVNPTGTLSLTTPPAFFSYAGLVLSTFVPVDLVPPNWTGTGSPQAVARPGSLSGGDLFQFWTCHGSSCAILRKDASDLAVAPGASLSLSVPPLSLSGSQTHTPSALPTFSNIASGGFSPGLSFLGYALFLSEPGVRYWRHFVSPGALGSATSYYLDLENAPGFAGVVPSPLSSVQLRATAFAGDQPLSALLAARPIPRETFNGHTLFLDRMWPVHLEAALLQSTITW
ncbi:transcriptional regulator, ArsR family (plasmid) [Allomeiothermus silvanus DSM 9946]|uniref:Transcriptional regulator, ArsR family n=1 Tax=Allomeiothermus silvanus (strain ATCC 700542 / DSM 9946 / NBRC 106475 / NCIMB 13440 / VI-R2) TaxID=526227 RepID=D7BIM6_ALLS1|nr:hypothetical protein [Allomeiothermus silvanus]ADH65032.1 hypothetical protein Mesil_3210 [Allomeiothermus silvanus DSM 9946]ADH65245.1 transcriptional regulator, ArsR family [Allomeiothermus silvanus DSM 9946]